MIVKVYNDRGAFLAAAVLSYEIREGVLQIATGARFDPEPEGEPFPLKKHGNPNVVTHDQATSELSQRCAANSCLVEIVPFKGTPPAVTSFCPPEMATSLA